MKILLSSRGSRGDVHPVIEIAAAFKDRGHRVSLSVPSLFDGACRQRGIVPSLYPEDSELVMRRLGSGIKALKTALDWFSQSVDEQFAFMLDESVGADAMVTSVNEIAAPTVAEYRGIPHFRIAYTPVLPGYHPPPLIPWQGLPAMGNRVLWAILNSTAGLFFRRFINWKRRELGMGPMDPVNRYFTGRSHTIMTLNRELAPPCRSWHGRYSFSYAGYCYGDIKGALDPGLEDFLCQGPPPVYIGFGSVSIDDPEGFTDLIVEAAQRSGSRVILGSGWTGLGLRSLPGNILPVRDTHHASLFPRCAGVIHHGGSGTTHTVARAGVPQFVMPQIADQYFWGHRVCRLGLGPKPIAPRRMTAAKLARAISALSDNRSFASAARRLGERMKDEDGVPAVVDIVSSMTGYQPELKKIRTKI